MFYMIVAGAIPAGPPLDAVEADIALHESAERLNACYGEELSEPLKPFGSRPVLIGVLRDGGRAPWLALDFLLESWPQPFGVVVDSWISRLMGRLQPGSTLGSLAVRRERLFIRGPQGEEAYRAATLLWEALIERWSARQVRTLRLLRKLGRQKQVADSMGVSPQSVSETLSRANWPRLSKSLDLVGRMLA